MRLIEYLERRKSNGVMTLTKRQAYLLGIPYPLKSGWIQKYAESFLMDSLVAKLDKCRSKKSASGALDLPMPKKVKKAESLGKDFILSHSFYESRDWLQLRYKVLADNAAKCMCCGASPKEGAILHVDHILPRSVDWKSALEYDNLQVLCSECNLGKSNWDATDWR